MFSWINIDQTSDLQIFIISEKMYLTIQQLIHHYAPACKSTRTEQISFLPRNLTLDLNSLEGNRF